MMDYRRTSGVSRALWIPIIWFSIIASRDVSQWWYLYSSQSHLLRSFITEGNPVDRNTFLILELFGLSILSKRKALNTQIIKDNKLLFLMYLYCLISILWSDYPIIAFKRFFKSCGNLIMALIIMTEEDHVEAMKTTFKRSMYVLLPLSVLFIKWYGELGRRYSMFDYHQISIGVATGKNTLGNLCLVSGVFLFWNLCTIWSQRFSFSGKHEIFDHFLVLFITFWLLFKADSITSLICVILGITIIVGTNLEIIKKNIGSIGTFIIIFIFFICALEVVFNVSTIILHTFGKNTTLTGRTELWGDVISMVERPFIGTGYDSFWLGERLNILWKKHLWGPRQAHSGYLEIYINLGRIGLFFLFILILSTYRNCLNYIKIDLNNGKFRLAFFAIFLFYNITEAVIFGMSIIWFVFLLITVKPPKRPFTKPREC